MTKYNKAKLDNFERAFRLPSSGCRDSCACGREFYDAENSWDWEDGEFEALEADEKATRLNYGVERIELEGKYYVRDCDCWHERAMRVMGFLDHYASQIAEYFKLEKERKEEIAKQAVTVDILYDEFLDGWRELGSAPRDATTLEVLMHDRTTKQAHWAQDLSGEEQPPFRGWFDSERRQIEDPIAWRYLR